MDRRIARTRTALLTALHQLMLKDPWDRISIQQICDAADISRSTFYGHFDNKKQLLDFAFDELETQLNESHPTRGLNRDGTFEFLPSLLDHVKTHCDLFRTNSTTSAGFAIFNRFKQVIDNLADQEMKRCSISKRNADEITFVSGGIFAMLEMWNRGGCREPVESLCRRIDTLILKQLA